MRPPAATGPLDRHTPWHYRSSSSNYVSEAPPMPALEPPAGARVLVTRRETFSAAHRLHNPAWDEAQNQAVFGLCNNPNGHGHNYVIEITVSGPIDPETGYVVDLKVLRDAVRQHLI